MALKSFLVSTLMKETRRQACGLDRWNPKQQWKRRMVWLSVHTGLKLGKGSSSIFTIWQFYSRLWLWKQIVTLSRSTWILPARFKGRTTHTDHSPHTSLASTARCCTHLAMHLLENFQLSSFVHPMMCIVAVVPVCHHPPALESSLLTRYGLFCKRSG